MSAIQYVSSITHRHTPHTHTHTHAGGAPRIQEQFGFEEVRDPDGLISHFVITCISIGGPATRVFWQKNSESFTEGQEDTVLEDTITAQYTHTLTVTGRNEGDYSCIVSNDMPFTNVRTLTVAGRYTYSVVTLLPWVPNLTFLYRNSDCHISDT